MFIMLYIHCGSHQYQSVKAIWKMRVIENESYQKLYSVFCRSVCCTVYEKPDEATVQHLRLESLSNFYFFYKDVLKQYKNDARKG